MKTRTGMLVKRRGRFYVRWKVDGRPFMKVLRDEGGNAITNKRDAETAKAAFMARFRLGDEKKTLEAIAGRIGGLDAAIERMEEEAADKLLIRDAWAAYARSHRRSDASEATMRQYAVQFGRWADWMAKRYPNAEELRDVTTEHAEAFVDYLTVEKRTPNTINKYLNLLALVFGVLAEKARIKSNPWEGIERKRNRPVTRRELTVDELRRVCESAEGELKTLLALGLYSGLRLGDCCRLRWSDADLVRHRLRVRSAKRDKPLIVPIHPVLMRILAEAKAENPSPYVVPGLAGEYERHVSNVTRKIQAHFAACGIETTRAVKGRSRAAVDVGFHSLRHSFVSLCREANAPLAVVEAIVGHSNPAMTRYYTHVGEDASQRAIAALPSVIGHESEPEPVPEDRDAAIIQRLESMTGATWERDRDAILAMLKAGAGPVEGAA